MPRPAHLQIHSGTKTGHLTRPDLNINVLYRWGRPSISVGCLFVCLFFAFPMSLAIRTFRSRPSTKKNAPPKAIFFFRSSHTWQSSLRPVLTARTCYIRTRVNTLRPCPYVTHTYGKYTLLRTQAEVADLGRGSNSNKANGFSVGKSGCPRLCYKSRLFGEHQVMSYT